MSVIPNDLFLVCQIFGMFPLVYTKQPDPKMRIEFSWGLFLKCVFVLMFLTVFSYFALYEDYMGYLAGEPIRMNKPTIVVPVMADVTLLNLMAFTIFYGVIRNYPAFIEMCNTLQKIDHDLQLKIDYPWLTVKMFLVFAHVTSLISATSVVRFHQSSKILLYVPVWMTYYIAATLLVQFHFAIESLAKRFVVINQMIEKEVMKQTFEQLLFVDLGLSKSTVSLGEYWLNYL